MVLRSVRLDAPRERHGRSGCPWCLLHIGARFPQQVVQVAARVPMVLGSQQLARPADDTGAMRARSPGHPPAWLVGSTTATRTAFRVLWRSIRAAISVNVRRLPPLSGLIERECQDASIKPLRGGSRPLLTKINVLPLGCPDTLVWGARAAKSPGTV